jgi:hypothetical protein
MAKLSFCFLLLLATSHTVLSYTYAGSASVISANEANSAVKCFADLLIPQAVRSSTTINDDFVEEVKAYVIRANPSVFSGNSAAQTCLAKVNMAAAVAECENLNPGSACETIDRIVAAVACPPDMTRVAGTNGIDSSSCYQNCPEGFVTNGVVCEKPQSYVLNPYTNELECNAANGGKLCALYHVKYFVPDCKENFYRLGSTVCIPKCSKNFADYDTFCLRPELQMTIGQTVTWAISASNN